MKVSDKDAGKVFVGASPLLESTQMMQQAWKMVINIDHLVLMVYDDDDDDDDYDDYDDDDDDHDAR